MKTQLTALTLSACLLGLSAAAPEVTKGDQSPNSKFLAAAATSQE
jgi:hypothetical protein